MKGSAPRRDPFIPPSTRCDLPSEKESLRVARAIARRVYKDGIPSGTRLASEEEAVAEYQVSRATLREALRYLQLHGAIEVRTGPSGGQFVADPGWRHSASTIALLLQFANATVETVMEARLCIDPGMAAVAARNASQADVERMGELLSEMRRRLADYDAFYDSYLRMWDVLATSSDNPLLGLLSPALRRITWTAGIRPNRTMRRGALIQLQSIHDAIAAHDEGAAYREMERLETGYLTLMRARYPDEIRKMVSWADSLP
jgi:GntR family transcriptional regulator, transcriptional repressor for pyruvate dehydrogenase complex